VLNPLRSVDQHIMDDTDLAGPIIFCLLFATFLFLVRIPLSSEILSNVKERKKPFRICIWLHFIRNNIFTFHIKLDVTYGDQLSSDCERVGILSTATCSYKCSWRWSLVRVWIPIAMFWRQWLHRILSRCRWASSTSWLTIVAISWCTYSASAIFVAVLQLTEMRALVAYPVCLFCKTTTFFLLIQRFGICGDDSV